MDHIESLGALATASRLRRLSHRLLRNVSKVYSDYGHDFDDRWLTIFLILRDKGSLSVTGIARELHLTHPAVVQVARDLVRRGLVRERSDREDRRVRMLELTRKGENLATKLEPIWTAINRATRDLLADSGVDFLKAVKKIETALDDEEMQSRVQKKLKRMRRSRRS